MDTAPQKHEKSASGHLLLLLCLALMGCRSQFAVPARQEAINSISPVQSHNLAYQYHSQPRKAQTKMASAAQTILSEFQPILAGLAEKTHVPLVFPTEIPFEFHPFVMTAEADVYEISLDTSADCEGIGYCTLGHIAARKKPSNQSLGTENFEADLENAEAVSLEHNLTGYYVEGECGANCEDDKVYWTQNGYEYMVGIKSGAREEVIEMANSAILSTLPALAR